MKRIYILLFIVVAIIGTAFAVFFSYERKIPEMLKEQSGINLMVAHAKFRPGPMVILEGVRIPQPAGFPAGDALTIKTVVIDLNELRGESMIVRSVTATGVSGNLAFNGTV